MGTPGSVEIIVSLYTFFFGFHCLTNLKSHVANSKYGQRIASLVLSTDVGSAGVTSNVSSAASPATFMLDASSSDKTQMYLVPFYSNATDVKDASSDSSSDAVNPSNSTDSGYATFIKVTLQMPMFDVDTAQMNPYCATYNAASNAPAPLTMEACMASHEDGDQSGAHKSQLFAYEAGTGIVRPMWYASDDDSDDTTPGDAYGSQNGTYTNTTMSANATSTISPTSTTTSSALGAGKDAINPTSTAAVQNLKSYEPFTRVPSLASAQNITLLFVPATPEVEDDQDGTGSTSTTNSDSSSTSTANYTSSSTYYYNTTSYATITTSIFSDPSAMAYAEAVAALDATFTETATDTERITRTVYETAVVTQSNSEGRISTRERHPQPSITRPDGPDVSTTTHGAAATATAYAVEVIGPDASADVSAGASAPISASAEPPVSTPSRPTPTPPNRPPLPSPPVSAPASASESVSASASVGAFALDVTLSEISSTSATATATATTTGTETANGTETLTSSGSASDSTMTPVDTTPYAWMFREGTVTPPKNRK